MPALGGEVYLRGPDERGEGLLPAAPGVPPGLENLESFTVDVYAEDFPGFAGFQIELDLPSGFYMSYLITAPVRNTTFFPQAGDANRGETVGFYSTEYIDPFEPELGYADKTISAEEEEEAVNPQNMIWTGHEGLTWLMTITVYYDATVGGNYTLDVYDDNTEFSDADEDALPYTIITGSVTIESGCDPGRRVGVNLQKEVYTIKRIKKSRPSSNVRHLFLICAICVICGFHLLPALPD